MSEYWYWAIILLLWLQGVIIIGWCHSIYPVWNYVYNDGRYLSPFLRLVTYVVWPVVLPWIVFISILGLIPGGIAFRYYDRFLRWTMRVFSTGA